MLQNFRRLTNSNKKLFCILLSMVLVFSTIFSFVSAYAETVTMTDEEYVEYLMSEMTQKEKIGQMIIAVVPADAVETIEKQHYGGYILLAYHFENSTPKKIRGRIKKWQKTSKINMFIAVDEEGGTVNRASKYKQFRKTPYKSPRKLYALGGYDLIKSDTINKSNFLLDLGINTNFAPVADVSYSSKNYIYCRAFSNNAKSTAKYIHTVVPVMNKKKVVATLKHYPGYGGNGDTHKKIIVDNRKLSTFEKRDLLPFIQGIEDAAPMIMVNHNIVTAFDSKNPASMSKEVHKYLRNELGFEGIIVTDGLGMSGVVDKYGSAKKVAVQAVIAGNDMLCTSDGKTTYKAVCQAVKDGKIKKSRIDASVRRILKVKLKYGIIENPYK